MSVLTGLTSGAVEVPVEIDGNGRLVVEGVTGTTGLPGPQGPQGAAGAGSSLGAGYWFAAQPWQKVDGTLTQYQRVTWCSGFGLFLAAGYNPSNNNRLASSPNGLTYTLRLSFSGDAGQIAYSQALNRAVFAGNNTIYYSNDGINWTAGTIAAGNWKNVAWSPSLGRFVATLYSGTGTNMGAYSDDGITWTVTSMPVTSSNTYVRINWSPRLNKFFAVPYVGTSILSTSDGITWQKNTMVASQWGNVIDVPAFGLLIAISATSPFLQTSPDGITWTTRSWTGTASQPADGAIAYSPELGLLLLHNTNFGLIASRDGIIYTTVPNTSVPSQNLPSSSYDLVWAPERFQFAGVHISFTHTLL